jgi:hypothetical protein
MLEELCRSCSELCYTSAGPTKACLAWGPSGDESSVILRLAYNIRDPSEKPSAFDSFAVSMYGALQDIHDKGDEYDGLGNS